jgi:hypothetical protein
MESEAARWELTIGHRDLSLPGCLKGCSTGWVSNAKGELPVSTRLRELRMMSVDEANQNRGSTKRKRDRQRIRVLRNIVDELEHGRRTTAAKHFREGQDHRLFPTGNGLPRWLIKSIGKEATGKLVDAFAQFPCFYCKKGLETCETCDGRGTIAGGIICEACAGLGVIRCSFCDGSGWVTYNVVPPGLRLTVLAERVNRASGEIETLLQKPAPKNASADPVKAAERCTKQMLDLNRQLGVLENAVVASKDLARTHPSSKQKLAKIAEACCHAAVEAQARVRLLAKQLAVCSTVQAEAVDADAAVRKRAKKGAAFYESLAASETLAGTALEHPFLQRAVAKLCQTDAAEGRAGRRKSGR